MWQTDGRTDGRTDWTIHRAAWSQLKITVILASHFMTHPVPCSQFWVALLRQTFHNSVQSWHNMVKVFNTSPPSAAYMRQWIESALGQIMACRLFSTKRLSKPILGYGQKGIKFSEILFIIQSFSFTKMPLKISSAKWRPFCPGGNKLNNPIRHPITQL